MTPYKLLDALKEELEPRMRQTKTINGKCAKVYTQCAPPRRTDDDDEKLFPYCLVKLGDGEDTTDSATQDVVLIFAVYDPADDYEGYRDIVNMIQVARERFAKNPVIGPFCAHKAMKWAFPEGDDEYPYYFGALLLKFDIPRIEEVSTNI